MTFEVIAGSGHCGTMWLSTVLHDTDRQTWTHELRSELTGLAWKEADLCPTNAPVFSEYWRVVKSSAIGGHFGDSNSWPPELLPEVNKVQPIDRVVYLTRDKDDQLNSLLTASPVWSSPDCLPKAAARRLDLYAEISGFPRSLNLLVESNDFMPDWLRSHGLNVEVYKLEDLTTDLDALRELAPLPDAQLRRWQKTKINSKKDRVLI